MKKIIFLVLLITNLFGAYISHDLPADYYCDICHKKVESTRAYNIPVYEFAMSVRNGKKIPLFIDICSDCLNKIETYRDKIELLGTVATASIYVTASIKQKEKK